jgi:hypothetical protein
MTDFRLDVSRLGFGCEKQARKLEAVPLLRETIHLRSIRIAYRRFYLSGAATVVNQPSTICVSVSTLNGLRR